MSVYQANHMQVEVAAGHVAASWDPSYLQRVNYADEDLVLRVLEQSQLKHAFRVNYLTQKELFLEPGSFRIELARTFRPEVEVRTTHDQVPGVVWLQDSPGSQVILWPGLDWAAIEHEVSSLHHLHWDTQAQVALRVTWVDGTVTWFEVPERDHLYLEGRIRHVELCVRRPDETAPLKTLFLARRPPVEPLEVLAAVDFTVSPPAPSLSLIRQIVETDTLQLKAVWSLPEAPRGLKLQLEKDGQTYRDHEDRPVEASGDWFFWGLEPGRYVARLVARKKTVLVSRPLTLPWRPNRVVLMPNSEEWLYCYWHVEASSWQTLTDKHGDLLGRVRCQLKVFHEWGGGMHHQPEHDREVNLDAARDYYLQLPPDRVYRVQLVAWIDGWKEEPLTELSNPAQTGRLSHGTNPISYSRVEMRGDHPTIRPLESPRGTSHYSLGYLLLHLHAHLPFIPDPVNFGQGDKWRPEGYPQEWYAEAVRETYLPLLEIMDALTNEGVDFKLSIDISPPLAAMMKSPRHQADVVETLDRLSRLARLEVARTTREEPHYATAARMHRRHLARCRDVYLGWGCDLTRAFSYFQERGKLEICTCVGTHPMLPLWQMVPSAIRGHCLAAAEFHEQTFGRASRGVWLPECAYAPGVERFLEEAGFAYFFSEGSTVTRADSPVEFGLNAPVFVRGSRVAVLPRDPETSEQVWSGEMGYPGDPDYLDFHIRGGPFKYNRITDRAGGPKQPYNPEWASGKAFSQAEHFITCRNARFRWLSGQMWKKPLIVAPYDAELFGHHWYEGPQFLYNLFKKLHYDQNQTELTTPSAYLAENPTAQEIHPNVSSWGDKATFEKWMSGATSWMYRHAHEAAEEMGRMAALQPPDGPIRRILCQAARQLMVAMSSDLPFVISNGHFVDRMKGQFFGALADFWRLSEMFWLAHEGQEVELEFVRHLELVNCIFPRVNPDWFRG
ncbi:MAG: hypothetical protein AMXMBFR33_15220 [Candidatus Xenobia bacterium]